MAKLIDILAPRRAEPSTFMWASREVNPQVAFKQQQNCSPLSHKTAVLKSAKIQELLLKFCHENGVPKQVLETQVLDILDEIGYNKNLKTIRWLGIVLAKICCKVCSSINLNEYRILQLKSNMGSCPVIMVPSHRSYADFILMSFICFNQDIAIPAIAAGMDFHGMWGMGSMLRDTGAFFMRRSYNDDSLYWTTFKQYVYQLVTKGELPIEFFVEGTRSRSNKSLTPKYGLILMILKAFFLSQVPDIWFVPINISYDRILEEKLFAFELLGIPKPKETTSGFFKSLGLIQEKYGSIYCTFAPPISAKQFFGSKLNRFNHNLKPIYQEEISDEEKKLIPGLAYEIVYQQQKHCTVTPFNLLAIILNNYISSGINTLDLEHCVSEVLWLKKITEQLGGNVVMTDAKQSILLALETHKNLIYLNSQGKIELVSNKITLNSRKFKAHELLEETLTYYVPLIMLQIYINPVLHYFVDVAILAVILRHHEYLSLERLLQEFHFLRGMLAQEFVTFHNKKKMEFDQALAHGIALNLIEEYSSNEYKLVNEPKLQAVLFSTLDNFILSYYFVYSCLIQFTKVEEKDIMTQVQQKVEKEMNKSRTFVHPYCLNLDTISNALNVSVSQGVLLRQRSKGSISYEVHQVLALEIRNRLEQCLDPEYAKVLHSKL